MSTTDGGGEPETGTIYEVHAIEPHPNYDTGILANDLVLLHLTESVSGITPIAYSSTNLDNS